MIREVKAYLVSCDAKNCKEESLRETKPSMRYMMQGRIIDLCDTHCRESLERGEFELKSDGA